MDMQIMAGALCLGVTLAFGILFLVIVARTFLFICRPHEVLVISGRKQGSRSQGTLEGYQPVFHGHVWRKPFLEKVDRMDLRTIPIDIEVINAYSKGGIPLHVHAVANVKISADPKEILNAVERFLGRDSSEIRRVAKETLEGHLRGVLAQLTPEEVNEDRLKFANELIDEAEDDFQKLGLHLDTLKIQNVSDDVKYLDSIGRKQIAAVIRDARIAESQALSEAEQVEAETRRQSEVAANEAETAVVEQTNKVRQYQAEQRARANAEEEQMLQRVAQARAEAEVELQELRQTLEKTRLQAEMILPAQAEREAERLRAHGDAAKIVENGKAGARALELVTEQWIAAGDDAADIYLIQQLESVISTVVERVNDVEIGEVVLLDDGTGRSLAHHVSAYPAMVSRILAELKDSTGVDVAAILSDAATRTHRAEV